MKEQSKGRRRACSTLSAASGQMAAIRKGCFASFFFFFLCRIFSLEGIWRFFITYCYYFIIIRFYFFHGGVDARPFFDFGGVDARPFFDFGGVDARPFFDFGGVDARPFSIMGGSMHDLFRLWGGECTNRRYYGGVNVRTADIMGG